MVAFLAFLRFLGQLLHIQLTGLKQHTPSLDASQERHGRYHQPVKRVKRDVAAITAIVLNSGPPRTAPWPDGAPGGAGPRPLEGTRKGPARLSDVIATGPAARGVSGGGRPGRGGASIPQGPFPPAVAYPFPPAPARDTISIVGRPAVQFNPLYPAGPLLAAGGPSCSGPAGYELAGE